MGTSTHASTHDQDHPIPPHPDRTGTSDETADGAHIVALHCSGANEMQWRRLRDALGATGSFHCPEFYGCERTGPWTGERGFTLMDDARLAIAAIDAVDGPVHLVGHSYGGGVALRVAVERRERIASLALYEPSAFHLLKTMGSAGAGALAEIRGVAHRTAAGLATGDYSAALAGFVDYWNTPGAWQALRPDVQAGLRVWAPKAPLDFHALIEEVTPVAAFRRLDIPVLLMRGTRVRRPSRAVIARLCEILPDCRVAVVDGAGHMGPFSHADEVNELIRAHVATVEAPGQKVTFAPAHERLDRARGFTVADRLAAIALRAA